jgi:hypothetical protein
MATRSCPLSFTLGKRRVKENSDINGKKEKR